MSLNRLSEEVHEIAKAKGWWDGPVDVAAVTRALLMMHSEISEAVEELRVVPVESLKVIVAEGEKPAGFAVELTDLIIRALDLAAAAYIDLDECYRAKVAYNRTRPHRHGGKAL